MYTQTHGLGTPTNIFSHGVQFLTEPTMYCCHRLESLPTVTVTTPILFTSVHNLSYTCLRHQLHNLSYTCLRHQLHILSHTCQLTSITHAQSYLSQLTSITHAQSYLSTHLNYTCSVILVNSPQLHMLSHTCQLTSITHAQSYLSENSSDELMLPNYHVTDVK